MSGIAGVARARDGAVDVDALLRMAASLRHRGPDGFGIYADGSVGLTHVRVDVAAPRDGIQPLLNEDDQVVVVCQGEVFNDAELRAELQAYGHRFRSDCGAEVLAHAYEQWGVAMLPHMNGEFAFAVYDRARETLLLARDRFGACPLFYAVAGGVLVFGSEVKALLASREVQATPDFVGLDEAFTFPGTCAPRTPFAGVSQLEPATYGIWRDGRFRTARYYELPIIDTDLEPIGAVATLDSLLRDSIALRLRGEEQVGGRLDWTVENRITCGLAFHQTERFPTFAVEASAAAAPAAEHRDHAAAAGPGHHLLRAQPREIAGAFADTVWYTEAPLIHLEPAAMYLLSRLIHEHAVKVVLGGEGAAELFLGHDLFKETVVRLFCLRQPESRVRPSLFGRIYPDLRAGGRASEFWRRAILTVSRPSDPLFSHMPRFALASRVKDFYSADTRLTLAGADPLAELRRRLPPAFAGWSPLNRAAFLELTTRLPSYLLSARADRVMAAHGVEVRYPFLDHRVAGFAATLPSESRLRGLREMDILRRWSDATLPDAPPRSDPDVDRLGVGAFFDEHRPDYVDELLDPDAIAHNGFFDAVAVAGLVRRGRAGKVTSVSETQALFAILSTQLWFQHFVARSFEPEPLRLHDAGVVIAPDASPRDERVSMGALA